MGSYTGYKKWSQVSLVLFEKPIMKTITTVQTLLGRTPMMALSFKVSKRSRPHKIMLKYITDEGCMLCGTIETAERFLLPCSVKRLTWPTLAH